MQRIVLCTAIGLLALAIGYGCAGDVGNAAQSPVSSRQMLVKQRFLAGIARLDIMVTRLESAIEAVPGDTASLQNARSVLAETRRAYKKVEFLSEYFFPETARALNGPVLDEVEEDDPNQIAIAPEGLQVIEANLYADPATPGDVLRNDIAALRSNLKRLRLMTEANELSGRNIFDAMLQEITRVMALGMAGFDTPIPECSIREAAAALEGVRWGYTIYQDDVERRSPAVAHATDSLFAAAITHLAEGAAGAEQFNRLRFIRDYAAPIYTALHRVRGILDIPGPDGHNAIAATAVSIFDRDAFDPLFFAPAYAWNTTPAHAELGRALFFDPVLSGNGRRACASCHRPELAFTDGMDRSVAFDQEGSVARNAPTLINAGLQGSSFLDGRVSYLEDQAHDVLANPAEMHGSVELAVVRLRQSGEYVQMFEKAYGKGENAITDLNIRIALASYIRSLVSSDSPFDRYMRGQDGAMPESAKRGFNLFMGSAKCGTCHFMPLFNGAVPPTFATTELEVLGVTERLDTLHPKLDPDMGGFSVHGLEIRRHAFKTPTLRNVGLTAPYMHNGAFATLEDVVEFYDHGGGAGMGLDIPNQTLPPDRLNLTERDEQDIIAFLKSLTDTTSLAARPAKLPEIAGIGGGRNVGGEY